MSSLFPNDDWVRWEGYSKDDDDQEKRSAIQAYMSNKIRLSEYIETSSQLLLDYIDSGIAIADVVWVDEKKTAESGEIIQGYVGPRLVRISPFDIVFDPTAINFASSPKITRSITTVGDIVINREEYKIVKSGKEIILPRKEFELLALLTSKPSKVFKREVILDKVWGNEVVVGGRTIDVHIRKLREKIGDDHFKTVKGVGYKFVL